MRSLLFYLMLSTSVAAQDAMSAEEFENFVQGNTLGYSTPPTEIYGTERYMPNRRVIWSTIDGRCTNGVWFESKGQICFRYDDSDSYPCWHFYEDNGALLGNFQAQPGIDYRIERIDDNSLFSCDRLTS